MRTPIPKSWSRKLYSPTEQRRVEYLFRQDTSATDEERAAYIREQTAELQKYRTIEQSPVEIQLWKKS